MREMMPVVAIVFNILALLGLGVGVFGDSSNNQDMLLIVVPLCASVSALTALLWPGARH